MRSRSWRLVRVITTTTTTTSTNTHTHSTTTTTTTATGPDKAFPEGTPEVYIQWRRQILKPLIGCLMINSVPKTSMNISPESLALAAQIDAVGATGKLLL